MHKFVRNLITEWRQLNLPFEGATVVIAVSGGADSVSLLLAMDELKRIGKLDLRLVAAHYNHALRDGESDADEEYVRRLTAERGIGFATERGRLVSEGNLEQTARNARYEFLDKVASNLKAHSVLTGHTVNDQAETFLINLVRGSGPEGLCGMKPVRPMNDEAPSAADGCEATDDDGGTSDPVLFPISRLLVRPLLTWAKRLDTEGFCHDSDVDYRYDTMNEDTAFKRVRIRKILLPLLEDMNPKIIETLANTATLMQKTTEVYLREHPAPLDDELKLGGLLKLDEHDRRGAIRSWLRQQRGTMRQLELKHIVAIERLVSSTKSGRTVEIPGGSVVKSGGKLVYKEN